MLPPLTFTPDRSLNRSFEDRDRFPVRYAIPLIGLVSLTLWLAIVEIVRVFI